MTTNNNNKINTAAANIKEYSAEDAAKILFDENQELQKKIDASIEAAAYFGIYIKRIVNSDYDSALHLLDAALMYSTRNRMFVEICYAYLNKHSIPTGHMADFAGCISGDNSRCRFESDEFRFLNYVAHTERYNEYRDMFVPIFSIFAIHNPKIEIICDFIKKNEILDISALFSDFRD